MNTYQLFKLQAAAASTIRPLVEPIHEIARKCTDIHDSQRQLEKTKPRPCERPLAPRQLAAVAMLVAGRTIRATAQSLGVNECTVRRWKSDPRFNAEVHRRTASTSVPTVNHENDPEVDDQDIENLYKEICGHVPSARSQR